MTRSLALAAIVCLSSFSEGFAKGCPTKPMVELITASETAFKRLTNDKMFTYPIAKLTPRASDFAYQTNIPIWVGTLEVVDNSGTIVASLIPQVHCNNLVEFSVNWKKQADGTINSGLGK